MFDQLEEIERRWRMAGSKSWQKANHPEGRMGYRIRGAQENTVAYVPDPKLAEAIRHAASDISWLLQEVATLREHIKELSSGRGAQLVVGKSRQADITLATFKIDNAEGLDDEEDDEH